MMKTSFCSLRSAIGLIPAGLLRLQTGNNTGLRAIRALFGMASAAAVLLLPACQVATPASRIEQNPLMFQSLPAEDKLLVQQGQIRSGMSPDAVFLAWGAPNAQPWVGEENGRKIERWLYTTLEPVMVTPAWGGPCLGPRGCWHGYSAAPDTAYIPRNTASVTFENGKVISWEARR